MSIVGGEPIPHLGLFASRFAGRWTPIHSLNARWRAQDLDPDVVFRDITFPSIATFGRLVAAFPQLQWLIMGSVPFCAHPSDPRTLSEFRRIPVPDCLVLCSLGGGCDACDVKSPNSTSSATSPALTELINVMAALTSQHILRIQITFYRALEENAKRRINVKKLMKVLHYLDLILSYPTFDRLETVCLDLSRCGTSVYRRATDHRIQDSTIPTQS